MKEWFIICAALLAPSCGPDSSAPAFPNSTAASPVETLALRLDTGDFQIFAGRASDEVVRDVAERLRAERARMMRDLDVAEVETVRVQIWQDETTWTEVLTTFLGQRLQATGYITGPAEIRLLANAQVRVNASHELAHALSLRVNRTFVNNPRWLWEAVALYENGEVIDPRSLPYMTNGRPPSLQSLNVDINASQQVYEIGYTIVEFVIVRFGRERLMALIRGAGDTDSVLGLSASEFEHAWYAFVRERYGF